ncbi:death-associated protein-like 1 isoform X1 [Corvus moneduloides]|uniref:death-associated protein-like 1 isoform X1 n=1 Tax=Corvus moneduloides TaxID=1196302 RepID=UPI001362A948|nr:death-associated protein-like 1 isoform X1 [Corvus moneduloides]
MALRRGVPPGRRLPAVKAGGMRVSKKQESGPVEKNAKPPGKEKSSAIVSFPQPQNMGVLVAEALNKFPCVGTITYFPEMNHRDDREEFPLGQERVSALKLFALLGWVVLDRAAWEFGSVQLVTGPAGATVYAVQCTDQGLN